MRTRGAKFSCFDSRPRGDATRTGIESPVLIYEVHADSRGECNFIRAIRVKKHHNSSALTSPYLAAINAACVRSLTPNFISTSET